MRSTPRPLSSSEIQCTQNRDDGVVARGLSTAQALEGDSLDQATGATDDHAVGPQLDKDALTREVVPAVSHGVAEGLPQHVARQPRNFLTVRAYQDDLTAELPRDQGQGVGHLPVEGSAERVPYVVRGRVRVEVPAYLDLCLGEAPGRVLQKEQCPRDREVPAVLAEQGVLTQSVQQLVVVPAVHAPKLGEHLEWNVSDRDV